MKKIIFFILAIVLLASKFRVSGIPMMVVMKDGKIVNSAMGFRPKQQIVNML